MDEHTRPTVANVGACGGLGKALAGLVKPRQSPWHLESWQMWCIIGTFVGSGLGVGWAGSNMKTAQTEAYMRAEAASKLAEGRSMDVEFAMRREQERKEAELLLRNQMAVKYCAKEGNIPVLGYDFTVVCLSRSHIEWDYNMKDPLPWL